MAASAFAPAKVNLFLHVGAPLADGYHPICSLMVFADVGDEVSLAPAGSPPLTIEGPFADGLPAGPENLVRRAADALGVSAPLRLDKRLPVASGLGGGSSDAGAALRLLAQGSAPERLEAIAASLGADGAACLWARPALAQGRGERLSSVPALPELHAVLVNPGVAVATPAVYRRLDEIGALSDVAPPALGEFSDARGLAGWLSGLRNDLEAAAVAVAPEVGEVLRGLAEAPQTLLARVSGSGGTCFALCAGRKEAETLADRISAAHPRWWVRPCRLGGPWP